MIYEFEGKTEREAIEQAAQELGLTRVRSMLKSSKTRVVAFLRKEKCAYGCIQMNLLLSALPQQ